jgi:tRNA(fMet)-specific endonuclease VapC
MPEYMLDTDTVSFALRGQGQVASRILEHHPAALCISSITLAELRYGAELRGSQKLHRLIDTFVVSIAVLPLDASAGEAFGTVAANLTRRGVPIGPFDTLLAAQALALSLTLVTNNARHFDRVTGLRTENWV